MVVPVGSLVNAGAVIVGASIGMAAGSLIPERLRTSLIQVLGLCTLVIGLSMANQPGVNLLLVIISCVLGIATGEIIKLSSYLDSLGDGLKKMLKSDNSRFTDGLVTASVIFCVGAMALVGSLEEGLGGSRTTLFNKSILDFCMAMMLASVSGSGVLFAFIPVLIYQGGLTLLAGSISPYLSEAIRSTLISTGGIMVLGIGLTLSGIKLFPLSNLLPALAYAVILGALFG